MEHALIISTAGKPNDVGTGPDSLEAYAAVVVLSLLEEHGAVGHLTHELGEPDVLASVARPFANESENCQHDEEVDGHGDHEKVKHEAECVADAIR